MTDQLQPPGSDAMPEAKPHWLTLLQAALIGVVAGLALHVFLSLVVLQGQGIGPERAGPAECRKSRPAREAAPPVSVPSARTDRVEVRLL